MSSGELDEHDTYRRRTTGFGVHLTLDGHPGQSQRPADPDAVRARLDQVPDVPGPDKLIEPCLIEAAARNERDPGASTGFALIAHRHLSMHALPRRRAVHADVFTCPDQPDQHRIRQSLMATFQPSQVASNLVFRDARCPLVRLDGEPLTGAPDPE